MKDKIYADLHCHSSASDHSYSTIYELICFAEKKGLKTLAVTDHGPAMPDSSSIWHFSNLRTLPAEYNGVRILKGAEANIIGESGEIDIPEYVLKRLDWVIASFHEEVYSSEDIKKNTETWLKVIKNPYVNMLGHPDRSPFNFDHREVVKACREYGKIIEINNHSFTMRKGRVEELRDILRLCREYDVLISLNSDAHVCFDVGVVDYALSCVEEFGYRKDLIVNYHPEMIEEIVNRRKEI